MTATKSWVPVAPAADPPSATMRATLIGTVLRSRPAAEKEALTRAFAERMLPALAAGRLRPVVDRVLPLAEAAAAHALLERNDTLGKVVLSIDPAGPGASR